MKGAFWACDSHIIAKLAGTASGSSLYKTSQSDNYPIFPTLKKRLCYSRISTEFQEQITFGEKLNGLLTNIFSK